MSGQKKWLGALLACTVLVSGNQTFSQGAAARSGLGDSSVEAPRSGLGYSSVAGAPKPQAGQTVTLLSDGRWLLTGGLRAGAVTSELQTTTAVSTGLTAAQSFGAPAQLIYGRTGHTATVLPDGTVAIIGGRGIDGSLVAAVEIFDPSSGETRLIADSGVTPRSQHTATLLPDGEVLIAGGVGADGRAAAGAQLWDPQSSTARSLAGNSGLARTESHATLLPNGDVALWGGQDSNGRALSSVELFDAHAQSFAELSSATDPGLVSILRSSPLAVASVLPATDSKDVAVDSRIAVVLGSPARVDAAIDHALSVVGPAGAVAGHVVAAEGGRLLFFDPSVELLPQTNYTVFVRGISDRNGKSFPFSTSSFLTRGFDGQQSATSTAAPSSSAPKSPAGKATAGAPSVLPSAAAVKNASRNSPQQKKDDADDDAAEDWIPQASNRHGQWRVLSLKGDPILVKLAPAASVSKLATGQTAIIGRVLRYHGRPLQGVAISAAGQNTVTDSTGSFVLQGVPPGITQLEVDGTNVWMHSRHYTKHFIRVQVASGKATSLPTPVYLPRVDPATEVPISSPASKELVLTHPAIPGLEVHIPEGAVLREFDGKIVTKLSITPIPLDRPPYPTPASFSVYFTLQPGGAYIDGNSKKMIRVIYPNYLGLRAGTRADFWNYDPQMGWQVYGQGTVSADGKQVVPDANVGFRKIISFGMGLSNAGNAPANGPAVGQDCTDGDPVDCGTGLFLHTVTDLAIFDTMPIGVTRTYRQNDPAKRAFGIGTNLSYSIYLDTMSSASLPTVVNLILSDGGRVPYVLQSGTGLSNAVWTQTSTPSGFYGSVLTSFNNSSGEGFRITMRDKTVLTFESDPPNALTNITDRFGNSIKLSVSGLQVNRVTAPNGRFIQFDYTNGLITRATDNIGRFATYSYDNIGHLMSATDPRGKIERFTYDSTDRMLTVTDKRNHLMVTNEYGSQGDNDGRVTKQTLADNAIWQFSYTHDADGNAITTVTDPNGSVKEETFNADGYITKVILAKGAPEQQTVMLARDGANVLLSTTDQLGRTTKYTHDGFGNVISITSLSGTPDSVTESFTYEPVFQNLLTHTDPLQHTTSFSYDYLGNMVSATDPLGATTRLTADARGNLASITNSLNKSEKFIYDQGDLAAIVDPLGRTSSVFTDAVGRQIGTSDPMGHNSRYDYDPMDNILRVTDSLAGVSALTYDESGNVLTIKDARNLAPHSHTYDVRDRVHTYTDPDGNVETYNYDGVGNLTSLIDRNNRTTSYTYDGLNRLKTISYADGSVVTLTWDGGNRLTKIEDTTNGTINRQFDGLDRLKEEVSPQGQLDYVYDAAGRRMQMTVNGANPIVYTYDDSNRLVQVARGSVAYAMDYDSLGRRKTITYPNGIVASATFDDANQLRALSYDNAGTHVGDLAYTYDPAGRRISQTGNLARLLIPTTVSSAVYDPANRLRTWGTQSLSYDNNGNLTSIGSSSFGWNVRNQLLSAADGGASFTYDALGRRASRTVSGLTTPYLHDGLSPALVGGKSIVDGLGLDEHLGQVSGSSATSYLVDASNNTVAVTDAAGATLANYSYSPYGETAVSGSADTPFQYTGRESDGDANLDYYRARYYSPTLNRFISEDPSGLTGGINSYAYADGDPISNIDPLGLFITSVDAACVADPSFCAEIMGTMVQNSAALSGDPCLIKAAQGVAGAMDKSAAILGLLALRKLKSVNLPSWKKMSVDMKHIAERHMAGGIYTAGRDVFPEGMSAKAVEDAVIQAYRYGERMSSQGADRVQVVGRAAGLQIEMWVNKATRTIETAYPVGR